MARKILLVVVALAAWVVFVNATFSPEEIESHALIDTACANPSCCIELYACYNGCDVGWSCHYGWEWGCVGAAVHCYPACDSEFPCCGD